MAAYNAFSKNFPTSKIKGCQFHFGQNIWRQIKKKGLVTHSKGAEAHRQIANILMLPLLPPQEINKAFCDIIEEISNVHQNFLKLTDYILHTYIEGALFPPSFWNLFDLIGIRPKTSNHIEGYHEFGSDNQIKRAEYINPVNGPNTVPDRLQQQLAEVYPNAVLKAIDSQMHGDKTKSAELTIYNLEFDNFLSSMGLQVYWSMSEYEIQGKIHTTLIQSPPSFSVPYSG
ncbi:unnamed protein product, partial [Rotaria sordida]